MRVWSRVDERVEHPQRNYHPKENLREKPRDQRSGWIPANRYRPPLRLAIEPTAVQYLLASRAQKTDGLRLGHGIPRIGDQLCWQLTTLRSAGDAGKEMTEELPSPCVLRGWEEKRGTRRKKHPPWRREECWDRKYAGKDRLCLFLSGRINRRARHQRGLRSVQASGSGAGDAARLF